MILYMNCPSCQEPDVCVDIDIFMNKLKILKKYNLPKNETDRQLMELVHKYFSDFNWCCKMRVISQLDSSEIYI
jgi:hypothetical protein